MQKKHLLIGLITCIVLNSYPQGQLSHALGREKILMDFGWRFTFGYASDFSKDFYHRTSDFTHFAKAGYGDGAAAPNFDDRAWREVDLPHDWAAELPFNKEASHTHGYRTVGWQYPETSVGWYRKRFNIPQEDFGRKISIQLEGAFRDASVWVNGFYLGTEPSGYASTSYDLTDYLNYGNENVIAVRVDASIEEGWYYEGAGIYRHVWLNKTNRLHVAEHGTFITSEITDNHADLTIRTTLQNQYDKEQQFKLVNVVYNQANQKVAMVESNLNLRGNTVKTYFQKVRVDKPALWSLDNPNLYRVETIILQNEELVDNYNTTIGIRSVRFDPDAGFFMNGERVMVKGVNHHQDHAGVGVAVPDALMEFRIRKLKEMGCNAIRTSHHPPAPALLDICDRLGMLVLNENRLMGINQVHLDLLKRFMIRDRNHPSVFIWSLGNEEWRIEGNDIGAQITKTMQDFAHQIDSTRAFTVALSGGWDWGSGKSIQVIGYNYIFHGDIDEHHRKFPWQSGIGTEETNTIGTRGVYVDDRVNGRMAAIQHYADSMGTEYGWRFYLARPFLAGLFFWTGFDYHGEPHPLYWPQVNTQFGILDLCGFPKDIYYYLKSWWTNEPVLHIANHWNWPDEHRGKNISLPIYSNADEVELRLNRKSLGRKQMPRNGHLDFEVPFTPGSLEAYGYVNGKTTMKHKLVTTGKPAGLMLGSSKDIIAADRQDVAVLTVQVNDSKGNLVPNAMNEVALTISGPGRIIGVGNGDPASHDPEQYIESVEQVYPSVSLYRMESQFPSEEELESVLSSSGWANAFERGYGVYPEEGIALFKGTFNLNRLSTETVITFYAKSLAANQSLFVNGKLIGSEIKRDDPNQVFLLDHSILKEGVNDVVFAGIPFVKQTQWEEINTNPGTLKVYNPPLQWRCKVFNGLAQIIVRSTGEKGEIAIGAVADGLLPSRIKILAE
ncbi:MAG: beta-galactosidase GalA [Tenuifilaceae bacterium]|nr:beta-galactosidase GalA [Tenuifilaceae bacterium]